MKSIQISNFSASNSSKLFIVAGPCQMESRDHSMMMAEKLTILTQKLGINFVFKTSFDKANRTSISGKRGLGLDGALKVFEEVKTTFKVPLLTDIHNETQPKQLAGIVDILQVPAFLCRQTDILQAAAESGAIVNVKKGQFLAPSDAKNIVQKLEHFNNHKILLTERGSSFGYNNLVVDMRGLEVMKQTGYPVILDATHATQSPGGLGSSSGGDRNMAFVLARAAVAVGIAGVFAEVHNDPDNAPSDGPCMIKLDTFETFLKQIIAIDEVVKGLCV
jgi:2-dehydro-3-deoxyphosphooctonate aldolase (KDO 8-P synthase)